MEFGRFVYWLVLLVCLSLCASSTQGNRFNVGGRDGWVLSPSLNYTRWAERNRFQVNDTLYFKYQKGSDSVLVVNKDDFFKCNTQNPIQRLDGGDSEFTFDRSGPFYFISGQDGNCAKGQKLFLIVLAVRHHKQPTPPGTPTSPSPSPSTPKAPSPYQPPSQSPSPVTNPPPTTSPSPSPSTSTSPVPAPSTGHSPSTSPVPAPSTGGTPSTSPVPAPSTGGTPSTSPVPAPSLTPTLSPPAPPPVVTPSPSLSPGAEGPTPPGTVTSPPPGSAESTAPGSPGNGASHGATAPSSVLGSGVVLVSVALISSFVQGGI